MSATAAAAESAKAERREVSYATLEELLEDAERCVRSGTSTSGNWSLGTILEHLALVMNKSIDGFGSQAPWIFRQVGRLIMKKRVLEKGMTPGFKLPTHAEAELVPGEVAPEKGLEDLRRAIARLRSETERSPHPAFGEMTVEEWNRMHLRHAQLHMSFTSGA